MTRWRAASLIGVHLLIGLHFLHWKLAGRTLAPIEPSEMFDTLHLGVVTVGFLFMAGVVVATAVAGRFFCAWGCHILALQDLCAWILKKLRIPARPVRSRTLLWVPPLAAAYLLIWPQVQRLMRREELPSWRVVSDPDGWTSFTTADLLRSFPGLAMTLFTLAVCGFVIVYFLGSRSFCSYACPYGAIFAAAERVAPLRIVAGPGECSQCGACVASCPSSIRVVEEVRQFGTVMSSNCMKDLDCVSVCPTDALKYGWTKPPLFRSWRAPRSLKKQYDFSLGEDLLMACIFISMLPVVRGLYNAVSLLLALALSALLAYFAVLFLRLVRHQRVVVRRTILKEAGQLTRGGWGVALFCGALSLFAIHSALIRYHVWAGERALAQIEALTTSEEQSPRLTLATPATKPPAARSARLQTAQSAALSHLEFAYRWGAARPAGLRRQLASLYQQMGFLHKAGNQFDALLDIDPNDMESRLRLGQLWWHDGEMELAKAHFETVATSTSESHDSIHNRLSGRTLHALSRLYLGDIEARLGNQQAAQRQFELAVQCDPKNADAHLALGAMQAAAGRLEQAVASFQSSAQLLPDSAAAYNNLGAIFVRMNRLEEALENYQISLAISPENSLTHVNVGLLLSQLGKLHEAEAAFRQALRLQPGDATAHAGLAQVLEALGQEEQAARHRAQAGKRDAQFRP